MALGTYLGLNYDMPQDDVTPAGYGQQQRPAPGRVRGQGQMEPEGPQTPDFLSSPQEGLQYTDELTKEYYDKFMGIRSLVDNAWKNYGIDVTKPDMSKEGAMDLHRLYQKAVADVMYTGDILKNSQEQLGKMNKGAIEGKGQFREGFDPSAQPVSTMDQREMFTGMEDSPVVEGAKQTSQYPIKNQPQYQKSLGQWQEGVNAIQERIVQEPQNAEYWKMQLEKMQQLQPRREYNPAELSAQKSAAGIGEEQEATPFTSMAQKLADISNFSAEGFDPVGIDPETGEVEMGVSAFSGDKLGKYNDRAGVSRDRIIETVTADPKTGKVKVKFSNEGTEGENYEDLGDFIKTYANSNFGTGGYGKVMSELKQQGYVKDDGTLDQKKLINSMVENPTVKDLTKLQNKKMYENVNEIAKEVTSSTNKLIDEFYEKNKGVMSPQWSQDPLVFNLPSGKPLQFKISGSGKDAKFTLVNKEAFPTSVMNNWKNLTKEELKKFLHKQGVMDTMFKEAINTPQEKVTPDDPNVTPEPAPINEAGTSVVQDNDSITDVSGLFKQ